MVISSGGAYSEATRWLKSTRQRFNKWAYARKGFGGTLLAELILLALIGLAAPSRFGATGSKTLQTGWPSWVLLGLIAACVLYVVSRWRYVKWLAGRLRDPFLRAPEGDARFEGAADALAAAPAPQRTRWALLWVWGPIALVSLGAICAMAVAYFVVDAILAGFEVGWESPVLAGVNLIVGLVLFRLAAARLSTWRLALAAHRAVTQGY